MSEVKRVLNLLKVFGVIFGAVFCISFNLLSLYASENPLDNKSGDVFVSLTRTALDRKELPTNTIIITQDDVARMKVQNVGQVLEKSPGIYIQKNTGLGSQHSARIRGFLNKQSVIYVDHRRIPRDVTGSVDLSQIPSESIDRIEVTRGAGSVLFGPDAEGGVIHIITKKAKGYTPSISATVIGQSYNTQIYQANVSTKRERAEGHMSLSRSQSDNYQTNSEFNNTSLNGNLGYDFGNIGKTMFYFSHSNSRVGLPGGTTYPVSLYDGEVERRARNQFAKQDDTNQSVELEHVVDVAHLVNVTARLSATDLLRESLSTTTGPVTTTSRVTRRNFYLQADGPLGFTGGFEYYQDQIRSPFSSVPQTNSYGIFLQNKFSYKKFIAVSGIRYDHSTEWEETVNPRLTLVYQANDAIKLSANVGSAFQSPTFADLADFQNSFPFAVLPRTSTAPLLSPEKSWSYDVGIEVNPIENITAKLTFYRSDIRDRLTFGNTSDGTRGTTSNLQKAYNQGVEAELYYRTFKWLDQSINYTYLESKGKGLSSGSLTENFSEEYVDLSFAPRNRVNYQALFFLPYHVEILQNIRYVGEQWTGNNRRDVMLPDYLVWDMSIGYRFKELSFNVGVNNVAERRYAQDGGFGITYPQPGRTFWGSISMRFM